MDHLYPPGPEFVADDLTAPGPTYKRRSQVAFLSLLLFIALYFSLTGWFAWTAYSYFQNSMEAGSGAWMGFGFAAAAAFLTVFLIKALFFVNHGGEVNDMEVTADEQPELFDFLYRLADDAGAPRPHRVFLSGRVNAAVFYDLTLLNLLIPSKKNLEIGLALVNGLNLGELKAVLAHEFGHFRQGSMAVGRWVYVAQQIATHIIYQRDILDRFLMGLSRFDIRIAWIGWILRLIVWALRALLDTAFSLVVLAQRSLSREMEFHADRVSVSLTGSDALIHALHRLGAADDAWERALGVAGQELAAGRAVTDIFVVQKIITQRMKEVLDDENYDTPPQLPAENPEEHRVFDTEQAHPPRMWSTHPPNRDRENNAKVTYVAAPIDERPAWDIFRDPQILREKMTEHLLQGGGGDVEQLQKAALTDTVANVNKIYSKVIYERRYRGSYMGRSVVREFPTGADAIAGVDPGSLTKEQFDRLYPEELSDRFEHWRNLEEERATLRALRDGTLVSPDGIIRHRGVILKRKKLPEAIRQMREECDAARHDLCEHDRLVRGVHYAAAASLGDDWRNYHKGLVELLHYADHTEANVADAQGRLGNLWSVVIADGKVSSGEVKQLLTVASDLHDVLVGVDQQAAEVKLSSDVAARLNIRDWRSALNEEFGLPSPDKNNLGEWLSAADGWASYFRNALSALCIEALESLLAAEIRIEQSIRSGEAPGAAPTPASVPSGYPVLLPNTERKLQTRLGLWDRFQTADGFFPGLARFGVAAAIIGGLLGVGIYASNDADITIYNGLVTGVSVTADGETVVVAPLDTGTISPKPTSDLSISAYSDDGLLIESLVVDASNSFNSYVYNVASAAPLIRWTAVYGTTDERPPNYIGAQSWVEANVDFLFSDPPSEINTSGSGGTRSVLSAFEDFDPRYVEDYLPEGAASDDLVRIHARWDHSNAPYSLVWLSLASALDGFPDILAHRLQRDENDVLALRFEQDTAADEVAKAAVCGRHTANAENAPRDSNWRYLAIRCGAGDEQQARAFIDAYAEWPDNSWIAGAAGYSYAEFGQWEPAVAALEDAYQRNRSLRLAYSDQLARARRMANGVDADISDVAPVSPWLQMNVVIESEQPVDRLEMQSYQLLARGDVDGAMTIARPVDVFGDQMLRLTAASDGASRDLIARAKALDPELGITDDTLWAALGFAARHNLPAGALLEQVDDLLGEDATLARDFFAAVNAPRIDIRAAERLLQGADMTARGHAYAMGVVALNDRAPQSWRDGAQRLLFVPERPYFR